MIENEKKKKKTPIFKLTIENRSPSPIFLKQTPIFWKQTPIFSKTNTDFSSQTQMSL